MHYSFDLKHPFQTMNGEKRVYLLRRQHLSASPPQDVTSETTDSWPSARFLGDGPAWWQLGALMLETTSCSQHEDRERLCAEVLVLAPLRLTL